MHLLLTPRLQLEDLQKAAQNFTQGGSGQQQAGGQGGAPPSGSNVDKYINQGLEFVENKSGHQFDQQTNAKIESGIKSAIDKYGSGQSGSN